MSTHSQKDKRDAHAAGAGTASQSTQQPQRPPKTSSSQETQKGSPEQSQPVAAQQASQTAATTGKSVAAAGSTKSRQASKHDAPRSSGPQEKPALKKKEADTPLLASPVKTTTTQLGRKEASAVKASNATASQASPVKSRGVPEGRLIKNPSQQSAAETVLADSLNKVANEIPLQSLPSQSQEKRGAISAVHTRIQGGSPGPKHPKAVEGSLIELPLVKLAVPEATARGQAAAPSQTGKEKDSAASKATTQQAAIEPLASAGKTPARKRDAKLHGKRDQCHKLRDAEKHVTSKPLQPSELAQGQRASMQVEHEQVSEPQHADDKRSDDGIPPEQPAKHETSHLALDALAGDSVGSSAGKCEAPSAKADLLETVKELGGSADVPAQHDLIEDAKARMKPLVAANFDELNGACDYFYLLERDNERIKAKTAGNTVNIDGELITLPPVSQPTRNLRQEGSAKEIERDPASGIQGENNSMEGSSSGFSEQHSMPRGYPQKHMYKHPKIDAERCQVSVDAVGAQLADKAQNSQITRAEHSYVGSRLGHLQSKEALSHAVVYSNLDLKPVMASFRAEIEEKNAEIAALGKMQQISTTNVQRNLQQKRRKRRSLSPEVTTLTFKDPLHDDSALNGFEGTMLPPAPVIQQSRCINVVGRANQAQLNPRLTRPRDTFTYETYQGSLKLQRKDEMLAPHALKKEPLLVFQGQKFTAANNEADNQKLDEYLTFCETVMRDAPVHGGHCGIWLRGSCMYRENALKLLSFYKYNYDLAKLHILYPMVMNLPENRATMIELARTHPDHLAQEVANAIIDLKGCKESEIDEIVNAFRRDLDERLNEEQLKYHLAVLQKVKVTVPEDIEQRIKQSQEFSREIKRKCNIQVGGNNRHTENQPAERKLKLSELQQLHEKMQTFSYITAEMVMLEQHLAKANEWVKRVEEIRGKEVQLKMINAICTDGRNMPVNFQELMDEIKQRQTLAQDLHNRIGNKLLMRRNRRGATDVKPSKRGQGASDLPAATQESAADELEDREQSFRSLLAEAKALHLQSDNVIKLTQKVADIDEWKSEVLRLFARHDEERRDFKRYRTKYQKLQSGPQVQHLELPLMAVLQKKLSLIEWRSKVEEFGTRVTRSEQRTSLQQIQAILEEGCEKNFLEKEGHFGSSMQATGYMLSHHVLSYAPLKDFRLEDISDGLPSSPQKEPDDAVMLEHEQNERVLQANGILTPLLSHFKSLEQLNSVYKDAINFDQIIAKILRKINCQSVVKLQETESSAAKKNEPEDCHMVEAEESGATSILLADERANEMLRASKVKFSALEELETRGQNMRIDLDSFKDFLQRLTDVRAAISRCKTYLKKHSKSVEGESSIDTFSVSSLEDFRELLEAHRKFQAMNVSTDEFTQLESHVSNLIFWLVLSAKIVRQYCRAIGLKHSQLKLIDLSEESSSQRETENPYQRNSDYDTLVVLCNELTSAEAVKLAKFEFLRDTDQGRLLLQIMDKTNSIVSKFGEERRSKRSENFDTAAYFKLLDNVCHSGLPVEEQVVEDARLELKREKWIKRYNDLQQMGSANADIASQSAHASTSTLQQTGSVSIKKLEALAKEFDISQELQQDEECDMLARQLKSQMEACQQWKVQFDEIFNSLDQFDPKNGLTQVQELLEHGERLDLRLQEYVDLRDHQSRMTEWKRTIVSIFNHSKSISLDQLDRHIKETNNLTQGANKPYSDLLASLKELATIWKIKAKTVLKIRPIDNLQTLMNQRGRAVPCDEDLFCICRQPENHGNGSHMISCDFCDMWYHYTCIGLQDHKVLQKAMYKCIGCAIREGSITCMTINQNALLPQSHSQMNAQGLPMGSIVSNQLVTNFYGPVLPNKAQILKEYQTCHEERSLGSYLLQSLKEGGQPNLVLPAWCTQENNIADHQAQAETERLLLEHFFTKQRIPFLQFQQLLQQGRDAIPLRLEEMNELSFIAERAESWRDRAQKQIEGGCRAQELWHNFLKINGLQSRHRKISEREMIAQQTEENRYDQTFVDLLVENESFPMLLPEVRKLSQMLQFRDWLRECFLLFLQFQSSACSSGSANQLPNGESAISYQIPKLRKIDLRKQTKKLILNGEILLGLSPELESLSLSNQQEPREDQFHEKLNQLIDEGSELECNVYYCLWLLCKLGGRNVSSGRLCDPVSMRQNIRGFNWSISDGSKLVEQLSFYQRPQQTPQDTPLINHRREEMRVIINRSSLILSQEPIIERKHADEELKQAINTSQHANVVADQDHLMISIELERAEDDAQDSAQLHADQTETLAVVNGQPHTDAVASSTALPPSNPEDIIMKQEDAVETVEMIEHSQSENLAAAPSQFNNRDSPQRKIAELKRELDEQQYMNMTDK